MNGPQENAMLPPPQEPRVTCRVLTLGATGQPHQPGTVVKGVGEYYLVQERGVLRKVDVFGQTPDGKLTYRLQRRLTHAEKKAAKRGRR